MLFYERYPMISSSMENSIRNNKSTTEYETFPQPLNNVQVEQLRQVYGYNIIVTGKPLAWYRVLYNALVHPFNILLIILAVASGAQGDIDTLCIISIIVFLSTTIRFFQEWKSLVAAKSLRKLVSNKVCALRYSFTGDQDQSVFDEMKRNVIEKEIPLEDIVPGDWIKLSAGDLIPADIQLIVSKDLFVSQSSLTGEALPVEKYVANNGNPMKSVNINGINLKSEVKINIPGSYPLVFKTRLNRLFREIIGLRVDHLKSSIDTQKLNLDIPDLCYMGTTIVSGTATAIVRKTGMNTYFGSMAKDLFKRRPQSAFQLGVRRISWLFFLIMACMVPPVLLIQGFVHQDWTDAFLFSLSIAVGLTPEMLPMIVNATLARGAILMSRKKCIVKNLDSIINMGGMDVLCTDKTGTLTENQVVLMRHVDYFGKTAAFPLQLTFLNSYFQTGLKNLLDMAIIKFVEKLNSISIESNFGDRVKSSITSRFVKVDEIPFDFVRRRMSVILQSINERLLISKGAVDEMIDICSHIYLGENITQHNIHLISDEKISCLGTKNDLESKVEINDLKIPEEKNVLKLTPEMISNLKHMNDLLNGDGIRVVAVAYKKFEEIPSEFQRSDERDLIFAGFVGFLDPPKESALPAIHFLREHNLNVKVLTGDSAVVCRKVCEEINLPVHSIVTTEDLEVASEERIAELAENGTIFAKLTPLQKAQIVRGLKRKNHIVGFLGDGINDSPALAESDIGISVDTGTDIAKESADIILLEKNLMVVADGVIYGRLTYGNTLKYIVMAISSNFGNVFSVLVASIWLPYLPMLPIHILVQNLLYDISQIAIPWDNMDPEFLMVSHRWSMKSILYFMLFMGPWSSIFDMTTFIYMWFYFNIKTNDDQNNVCLFQTTWFNEGLLTQTLIVHMIRTPKIPFIQSRASNSLIAMTLIIVSIGLALPYIPLINESVHMVHLHPMCYPYIFAAILSYFIVVQFAKLIYIKIFGEWF